MRVMPSVSDTIVPTLRASVTPLKFSIRCLMRSLISVALMAMSVSCANSLCGQFVCDALEACAQRAVDHQVARAQNGTTDQRGIHLGLHTDASLELLLQRPRESIELSVREWRGGGDRHVHHAFRLVLHRIEQRRDLGQVRETS